MLVAFTILVSGISIYVFEERSNPNINTLYDAFYWALVTISTVGYGDISPTTHEGRAITMIIILVGVGLISFATSIIVSAFSEKLSEIRENRIIHTARRLDDYYIICGYTHMARLLAKRFKREGVDFLIIDYDEHAVQQALADGYLAICEDATQKDAFRHINFDNVKAVMALTNSDMHNIYICLNIRSFSKECFIISRAVDYSSHKKLKLAGANYIISPYVTAGFFAAKIIDEPIAIEAINDILIARKNALCEQVEVIKGSFLDGAKVGDIDFDKFKLILLGIVRIDEKSPSEEFRYKFLFNPDEDELLAAGDILIVMGYTISLAHFKSQVVESSLHHGKKS